MSHDEDLDQSSRALQKTLFVLSQCMITRARGFRELISRLPVHVLDVGIYKGGAACVSGAFLLSPHRPIGRIYIGEPTTRLQGEGVGDFSGGCCALVPFTKPSPDEAGAHEWSFSSLPTHMIERWRQPPLLYWSSSLQQAHFLYLLTHTWAQYSITYFVKN